MKRALSSGTLRESMAHILCLSQRDFKGIFGETMGAYLFVKLKEEFQGDVARWLCSLDTSNADILCNHLQEHFEIFGVR